MNKATINISAHIYRLKLVLIFQGQMSWSAIAEFQVNCMYIVCAQLFTCVWLLAISWAVAHQALLSMEFSRQELYTGAVLRWWRNRMGRPLSPPQIHQKIIWMLSNFHKTTSNADRGHQVPRKAAHSLWKEVEQNLTDKKRDKRVRDRDPSWWGSSEGEVSKQ